MLTVNMYGTLGSSLDASVLVLAISVFSGPVGEVSTNDSTVTWNLIDSPEINKKGIKIYLPNLSLFSDIILFKIILITFNNVFRKSHILVVQFKAFLPWLYAGLKNHGGRNFLKEFRPVYGTVSTQHHEEFEQL